MTNIFGNNLVIADSDALVGLVYKEDALHEQRLQIYRYLKEDNIDTFTPYPIVLEAATLLARRFKRSDLAREVLSKYPETERPVDINIARLVVDLYNPKTSKKNTPFDHYVLALAKKNNIKLVFSFDSFYKKNGLTLIKDLIR